MTSVGHEKRRLCFPFKWSVSIRGAKSHFLVNRSSVRQKLLPSSLALLLSSTSTFATKPIGHLLRWDSNKNYRDTDSIETFACDIDNLVTKSVKIRSKFPNICWLTLSARISRFIPTTNKKTGKSQGLTGRHNVIWTTPGTTDWSVRWQVTSHTIGSYSGNHLILKTWL